MYSDLQYIDHEYNYNYVCTQLVHRNLKADSGCGQALFRLLTTNVYGVFCRHEVY